MQFVWLSQNTSPLKIVCVVKTCSDSNFSATHMIKVYQLRLLLSWNRQNGLIALSPAGHNLQGDNTATQERVWTCNESGLLCTGPSYLEYSHEVKMALVFVHSRMHTFPILISPLPSLMPHIASSLSIFYHQHASSKLPCKNLCNWYTYTLSLFLHWFVSTWLQVPKHFHKKQLPWSFQKHESQAQRY